MCLKMFDNYIFFFQTQAVSQVVYNKYENTHPWAGPKQKNPDPFMQRPAPNQQQTARTSGYTGHKKIYRTSCRISGLFLYHEIRWKSVGPGPVTGYPAKPYSNPVPSNCFLDQEENFLRFINLEFAKKKVSRINTSTDASHGHIFM